MPLLSGIEAMKIETSKELKIEERTQFLHLRAEDIIGVRSIDLKDLNVDESFCLHWTKLFANAQFDRVSFNNCDFAESVFYIFLGLVVADLRITRCAITVYAAEEVLRGINPYNIKCIDFSNNRLGENEEMLGMILQEYVYGIMALSSLDLRHNGITESFIGCTFAVQKSIDPSCSVSVRF